MGRRGEGGGGRKGKDIKGFGGGIHSFSDFCLALDFMDMNRTQKDTQSGGRGGGIDRRWTETGAGRKKVETKESEQEEINTYGKSNLFVGALSWLWPERR